MWKKPGGIPLLHLTRQVICVLFFSFLSVRAIAALLSVELSVWFSPWQTLYYGWMDGWMDGRTGGRGWKCKLGWVGKVSRI